jgi:uncharacterized protein (TIGR00255 family)
MIKSMTGYGRGETRGENFFATVELRSINNRNLDIHWRAPLELAASELPMKKLIQSRILRGRVDVTVSLQVNQAIRYELNRPMIKGYLDALRAIRDEFGLAGDADLASVARLPNVMQANSDGSSTADETTNGVEAALRKALDALIGMRTVEGAELQSELLKRIARIESQLDIVEANAPQIVEQHRDKLKARLAELLDGVAIDETRLAQEVAYLAERSDITEEITRLRSHIVQLRELVLNGDEIGKKLDFLLQETNREANTILSKSSELAICDAAIEIKTDVEKLREQAQNVE